MRMIENNKWENKVKPRIHACLTLMQEQRKTDYNTGAFGKLFFRNLKVADEVVELRGPLVQMMRAVVKSLPNSEQLCFIMGSRSSLPYSIATIIDEVCQAVAIEAEEQFGNSSWMHRLTLKRTLGEWKETEVHLASGNTYDWSRDVTFDTMTPHQYGETRAKYFRRKLTEWFKMGVWLGTIDELGTREFTIRLTRFKNGLNIGE